MHRLTVVTWYRLFVCSQLINRGLGGLLSGLLLVCVADIGRASLGLLGRFSAPGILISARHCFVSCKSGH